MKTNIIPVAALSVLLAASCSKQESLTAPQGPLPEGISVSEEPFDSFIASIRTDDTRTTYTWEDSRLKTFWEEGDTLAFSPAARSGYASLYTAGGSGSEVTFNKISGNDLNASIYGLYYPGKRVASDIQFINFSYTGQVQDAADPMKHLAKFHSMRKIVTEKNNYDFSLCDQSSCMRFVLSGTEFDSPEQITLSVYRDGAKLCCFKSTNHLDEWYTDGSASASCKEASSLSLDLSGYGTSDNLTAWMMMSNEDVALSKGDEVRVEVTCRDLIHSCSVTLGSDLTLTGGRCHSFIRSSGWSSRENVPETVSPYDRKVTVIQSGAEGLNVIFLGDGFIEEDITDGTYDKIMREGCEAFFEYLPYSYYRDLFNVYYVTAVSKERTNATNTGLNGAQNNGSETVFSTAFTPYSTSVDGDKETAREYASLALGEDAATLIQNAVIVVIANQECHAGTCHMSISLNENYDYGICNSIVFMGRGRDEDNFKALIRHEAGGHGFGLLADEYYYENDSIDMQDWYDLMYLQGFGFYRNVDIFIDEDLYSLLPEGSGFELSTTDNCYWKDLFGTANRYEDSDVESLGLYEGAYTMMYGFGRPTYDSQKSIMYSNYGRYNAPSRRQIVYRLRQLTGEDSGKNWGTEEELSYFLGIDIEHLFTAIPASSQSEVKQNSLVEVPQLQSAPVMIPGKWVDGKFIAEMQDSE
ncbi:MAG: M64 family metallopeptidase [Candidatus Cryptobacteroides sp.]